MSRVLVVGGDGLIGRALVEELRTAGHDVVATTRRAPRDGAIRLDLEAEPPPGLAEGFDHLVIAAAMTGRAACAEAPERARRVNALAPERLAQPVLARGGHVLHLSSHIVLGGAEPRLPVDAPYAPCDPYSEQKAEAERRLRALPGAERGLAILRLTKVLDPASGVIARWCRAIAEGRQSEVYTDLLMAPITLGRAVGTARAIIERRQAGVHHLSGWPEISFAEFAMRLGRRAGWAPGLIRPVAGRGTNPIAAATPPHASLACEDPMSPDEAIEALAERLA